MLAKGKAVLITGGGRGIGAASAEVFARNDAACIWIVDVDEEQGRAQMEKLQ